MIYGKLMWHTLHAASLSDHRGRGEPRGNIREVTVAAIAFVHVN